MGKRVIVVDYDLRKPKGKSFSVNRLDEGVASILNNNTDWHDKVIHNEQYQLDLLLCGPVPSQPG